ncbi:ATP synthase subunit epsilon, mitochondrial-like [Rhincodon typus]|uniref:ATP synthase subunit epsilon, mitochondrial-like n=1 Tax=Rhincodon typus TaxID=259920 RepID=UPI0009A41C39|nr:ATP synthase subunit epsilon, mitochondrial-like [Rhincodon typus]
MVLFWRQMSLSYIQYSQIGAQADRTALKLQFQAEAKKAADIKVKANKPNKKKE